MRGSDGAGDGDEGQPLPSGPDGEGEPYEEGEGEGEGDEATYFVEQEEVIERLGRLASPDPASLAAAAAAAASVEDALADDVEAIKRILDKYQEQSNLLDPALERMLGIALGRAREIVLRYHEASMADGAADAPFSFQPPEHAQLHALLVFVYTLCRLRGHKTVVKFFPHEASDLEPVLHALQAQDRGDHARWQARYGLLLWLSMLVLVPFDICSIDSGLASGVAEQQRTLVGALCELARGYLEDPGPTREAAAVCLASLLKRPDMEAEQLSAFLAWSEGVLVREARSEPLDSSVGLSSSSSRPPRGHDQFLVIGVLQTLALLLKAGHRQNLLGFLPSLLHSLTSPQLAADFGSQTLNRKLKMKLLQRIGLAYLPPRVAAWRYRRGQRSLLDNLTQAARSAAAAAAAAAVAAACPQPPAAAVQHEEGEVEGEEEEEEEGAAMMDDVPEDLEEILEELLSGLRDRDTIVRWSAAKGIGRITSRLPQSFADEVVESVLMSFTDGATDSSWHGGCLALAELARRGLLLPARLSEVVPVVARAIQYDVRRGHSSVGAHVRDAACYVCWAFARAYSPQVMRPHVQKLCEGMLVTSLFDREINCRRAASAAFQENVGRQGHQNFPYGIEILTAADYFTLGNRQAAYLSISPFVARFPPYKRAIVDHLAEVKLRHWDPAIRALASQALYRLTGLAKAHMLEVVAPALLAQVDAVDLNRRHGAILGLAEVFLSLAQQPCYLPGPLVERVVDVVPKIEKARLYRGRGGEFVRAAACRLIECIALSGVGLSVKIQLRLLDSIDENLRHPVEEVQAKAVAAMRAFAKTYFGGGDAPPSARLQARVVDKYLATVTTDDNVAVTRGFVLALGALPSRLLRPSVDPILAALDELTQPDRRVGDEPDAETRHNALLALVEVCQTLGVGGQGLTRAQVAKALAILLRAMEDYAMDKRGDVGSWCRLAALRGLATVLGLAVAAASAAPSAPSKSPAPARRQEEDEGLLRVGGLVQTAYGRGTLVDLRCDGQVCHVRFPAGQSGAFFFPYNNSTGLFARAAVTSAGPEQGIIGSETEAAATEEGSPYVEPATATAAVCAVLKQLCEKLDAVRECAGEVLLALLCRQEPPLPGLPHRELLQAALFPDGGGGADGSATPFKAGSPTLIFPRAVRLLGVDPYHEAVVAGLVVSIGGLTESVVRASLGAVVDWAQAVRRTQREAVGKLGRTFLRLLDIHARDDRVVLPLLRSLDLLVQKGVFLEEDLHLAAPSASSSSSSSSPPPPPPSLARGLLDSLKQEVQGCKDVKKLLAALAVAVHLLAPLSFEAGQEEREAGAGAMRLVMVLLGHRFPRVRKAAAEQLYTKLLLDDGHLLGRGGPRAQEEALEILSTSGWDRADLASVRRARDALCQLMALPAPSVASGPGDGAPGGRKAGGASAEDELASYAALVKSMGY